SDTILDIEGSTLHKGEIWVGTDDGLVQLTLDGGKHWSNVTPPGGPEFGRYATVAPSTLVDGTAYAINDGHYTGDNTPYVFVTHDFGKHWTSIANGLPKDEWARSIRPDIRNKNLVYLGTEEGIWISYNDGTTWQRFKNNLPTVSVHDIRMQPQFDDLVIATHGRSVYIMDDMTPIQQLQEAVAHGSWLFQPRTGYEYNLRQDDEGTYTNYAAANPPTGVMITYYQNAVQKTAPKLEILDDHGRVIRTVQGTHKVHGKDVPYVPNKVGLNRYVWDFSIDGPVKWMGAAKKSYRGPDSGPAVPPGSYSVSMTLAGKTYVKYFEVKADPRTKYTQKQIVDSFNFAKQLEGKFSSVDTMLNNIDSVTKSLNDASAAAKKANDTALAAKLDAALTARDAVFNFLTADYHNDEDSIERPGALREDLQFGQYLAGTELTPAILGLARRVGVEYQSGIAQYNAFVTNTLPSVDAALKASNQKPLPAISTVRAQ
ncbi:MAG: WD40/YVTN/BNR-like repeat-containing protein, partial [Vulcanimicrobiaceae bacterium]